MKRLIGLLTALLCIALVFCLVSCGESEYTREQEAKKEAIYNRGYDAGFAEGEWEGIKNAQERFEDFTRWDLPHDIENERGMSPEEAITILEHYADGEPTTKSELNKAIWTIREYYWAVYNAVGDIDNYAQ